jgi:hypothetical protein
VLESPKLEAAARSVASATPVISVNIYPRTLSQRPHLPAAYLLSIKIESSAIAVILFPSSTAIFRHDFIITREPEAGSRNP